MKESRKNKTDEKIDITDVKALIALETMINSKAGNLLYLSKRMLSLIIALKERGIFHSEYSLAYNLHKEKSLKQEWDNFDHNLVKTLDVSSTKGRSHFDSCFIELHKILPRQIMDDSKDLNILTSACVMLGRYKYKHMRPKDILLFFLIERQLSGMAHEAIGYWKAKLEEKKRGQNNVKKRTDKKEEHKAQLKEMMKTMKRKECRIKAQQAFGVTDRTVLNYLKEIEEEKTAFLRKKGDIA